MVKALRIRKQDRVLVNDSIYIVTEIWIGKHQKYGFPKMIFTLVNIDEQITYTCGIIDNISLYKPSS